jgi:hypothetical protein
MITNAAMTDNMPTTHNPEIQIGDRTQTQLQSITPSNLNAMKRIDRSPTKPIPPELDELEFLDICPPQKHSIKIANAPDHHQEP